MLRKEVSFFFNWRFLLVRLFDVWGRRTSELADTYFGKLFSAAVS